jgi:hypothetical protein
MITNLKTTFEQQGWLGPLPIFSKEETVKYRNAIMDADQKLDLMNSDYRCKSNVLFSWADEISRNSTLISYIEQLIGPNIHCWDTLFWIKKPGDGKDVSFHQDATYWNFTNKKLQLILAQIINENKYRIILTGDHGFRSDKRINPHFTFTAFYGFNNYDLEKINSVQDLGSLINGSF